MLLPSVSYRHLPTRDGRHRNYMISEVAKILRAFAARTQDLPRLDVAIMNVGLERNMWWIGSWPQRL